MNHHSGFIIGVVHVLPSFLQKNSTKKTPWKLQLIYNYLVVLWNDCRSIREYEMTKLKFTVCSSSSYFIIIIIIITRTASHTTKYIHQRDSPPR